MLKRTWFLAVAVSLFSSLLPAADVAGRVDFLTRRGQKPARTETLIWLEPLAGQNLAKPQSAQMMTRGKAILPHVIAVPAGSAVDFPNEDPITHNLFSVSQSNPFDLGLYRRGASKTHKFVKPGVVNVYCNVHPNMSAVIHVMNTPYYGFAGAAGAFHLVAVPAGRYRLIAWNELGGTAQADITISDHGAVSGNTNLTIDSRNYRTAQHNNKFGQPYRPARTQDY